MSYLRQAFYLLPPAVIISLILYIPIFIVAKRKHQWSAVRHLFNYIFVGYVVMLGAITLTLVPVFGRLSYSLNLIPFKAFHDSYVFASTHVLQQYMLNIVMFIPLGFLLPIVFPNKVTWKRIVIVILSVTLSIETAQFFTGRVVDIDDVITNFFGGMTGFSLYVLAEHLLGRTSVWRNVCRGCSFKSRRNAILATAIITMAWAAPITAVVIDATAEFGRLPDYHFRLPGDAVIAAELNHHTIDGRVYKTSPPEMPEEIMRKLIENLSVTGQSAWTPDRWDYRFNSEHLSIGVLRDGTWRVNYYAGDLPTGQDAIVSDDEVCLDIARSELQKLGVDISSLQLKEIELHYGTISYNESTTTTYLAGKQVVFVDATSTEDRVVTGEVIVTIGHDDMVSRINDNREYHEYLQSVSAISQQEALERMRNSGQRVTGLSQVVVTDIIPDFVVESRKGHLHPAWRIIGTVENEAGEEVEWFALIDARR